MSRALLSHDTGMGMEVFATLAGAAIQGQIVGGAPCQEDTHLQFTERHRRALWEQTLYRWMTHISLYKIQ